MAKTTDDYLKEITTFYWENDFNPEISKMQELAQFAKLVVDKNKKINLISRNDVSKIIENHIFLSAYITEYIPDKCIHFLDIGTGGGFPGIPIAIMRPELRGVLADSIGKKIDAVDEFINDLMLSNIEAEKNRVESKEFIEKHQKSFDLIVSRATVPLIILMRYAVPLIKEKAFLMAIKGGDLTQEFEKMKLKYGSHIKKSTTYELHYKPTNIKNVKDKKLVLLELVA